MYNGFERRKSIRTLLDDKMICYKLYDQPGVYGTDASPLCIGVRDISYGGIGGICKGKFKKGVHMYVRLEHNGVDCEFELEVVWRRYKVLFYDHGFRFVNLTKEKLMFLDRYIKSQKSEGE